MVDKTRPVIMTTSYPQQGAKRYDQLVMYGFGQTAARDGSMRLPARWIRGRRRGRIDTRRRGTYVGEGEGSYERSKVREVSARSVAPRDGAASPSADGGDGAFRDRRSRDATIARAGERRRTLRARGGKGGWKMVGGSSGRKGGRVAVSSGTLSMDLESSARRTQRPFIDPANHALISVGAFLHRFFEREVILAPCFSDVQSVLQFVDRFFSSIVVIIKISQISKSAKINEYRGLVSI